MFRLLFLYVFIYSCTESQIEKLENQNLASVKTTVNQNSLVCDGQKKMGEADCLSSKRGATEVIVDNECPSAESTKSKWQCKVLSCGSAYYLFNNECIPKTCSSVEKLLVSCKDEIRGSLKAEREFRCDLATKKYKMESNCILQQCSEGFYQSDNFCLPSICTPNAIEKKSCVDQVANSSEAYVSKICDFEGRTYKNTECTVSACIAGYELKNNVCIKKVCEPLEIKTTKCYAENAINAEVTSYCNQNGTHSTETSCVVKTCKDGYRLVNNRCAPNFCTPNSVTIKSCTEEKANALSAEYKEICNQNGESVSYSECTVSACIAGYELKNNECIQKVCVPHSKISKDCTSTIPNALEASVLWTCNESGDEMVSSGVCGNIKCANGHYLDGKSCRPFMCSKGVVRTELCSAENAMEARINFTCAEDEKSEIIGECQINSCNKDFVLEGNKCVKNTSYLLYYFL